MNDQKIVQSDVWSTKMHALQLVLRSQIKTFKYLRYILVFQMHAIRKQNISHQSEP
jgi:hypothetical protein